jgi:hypothetical protein
MSDEKLKREAHCKECHKLIPAEEYSRYGGKCNSCVQKQNVKEQERKMERDR